MIQPIEFEYNNIKFRSKLEARWAVFLDKMGYNWVYEPEAFKLKDNLIYIPDFELIDHRMYLEIKPRELTEKEEEKCKLLCLKTGFGVIKCIGLPYYKHYYFYNHESLKHGYDIANDMIFIPKNDKYHPWYMASGLVDEEVKDYFQSIDYDLAINSAKSLRYEYKKR